MKNWNVPSIPIEAAKRKSRTLKPDGCVTRISLSTIDLAATRPFTPGPDNPANLDLLTINRRWHSLLLLTV
jgi:hypothetical protein